MKSVSEGRTIAAAAPRSRVVCVAALVAAVFAACLGFAPEPAPVPVRWEFDVREGPLRMAVVEVPDVGPRKYFYLTYTVTNHWGQDLLLAPAFDLVMSDGRVYRSGVGVPGAVTEEILRRLDNPLIQDQISIIGQVLQGRENARDGVVIWPAEVLEPEEVVIFAAGFSGENSPYLVTDPETGRQRRHVLRKTLMLWYDTPGELVDRGSRPLELVERRWVMR